MDHARSVRLWNTVLMSNAFFIHKTFDNGTLLKRSVLKELKALKINTSNFGTGFALKYYRTLKKW